MAKSLLEVCQQGVASFVDCSDPLCTGGPKGASSCRTISPLVGYCMGAKHFVCVCYILHVYSEAVALCCCFCVLAQSRWGRSSWLMLVCTCHVLPMPNNVWRTHIHMYIHVYIHTYIHTHTHTNLNWLHIMIIGTSLVSPTLAWVHWARVGI